MLDEAMAKPGSPKPPPELAGNFKALAYGTLNISSTVGIVFANKVVMQHFRFHFPVALTFIHSLVTLLGMLIMAKMGVFIVRRVPVMRAAPIAAAYVLFIVFNNLSLKLNTVGFYQIAKVAITPVMVFIELVWYNKRPSREVLFAISVLILGVTMATVWDQEVSANLPGVCVGCSATVMSALYGIWAGAKQKELNLDAMQLLHQASPIATAMLLVLIPVVEPMGLPLPLPLQLPSGPAPGTLLAYRPSLLSGSAIALSAVLGLLVTLSSFLVIGATSPLTYNVVGHMKTVFIMGGAFLLFGDLATPIKLAGIAVALGGVSWYTSIKLRR